MKTGISETSHLAFPDVYAVLCNSQFRIETKFVFELNQRLTKIGKKFNCNNLSFMSFIYNGMYIQ